MLGLSKNKKTSSIILLIFLFILIAFISKQVIPWFSAFSLGQLSDADAIAKLNFYSSDFMTGAIIVLLVLILVDFLSSKIDFKFFPSSIDGIVPINPIILIFLTFAISLLLFTNVQYLKTTGQTGFEAFPQTSFVLVQESGFDKQSPYNDAGRLALAGEPASFSETSFAFGVGFLIVTIITWLFMFLTGKFLNPLISRSIIAGSIIAVGILIHIWVYGRFQDILFGSVLFFWIISAGIYFFFGLLPMWAFHLVNNLVVASYLIWDAGQVVFWGNTIAILIFVLTLAVLGSLRKINQIRQVSTTPASAG